VGDSLPIEGAVAPSPGAAWRSAPSIVGNRRVVVLRPPGSVFSALWPHLRRLPGYWDLLWTLTAHRIKVRYKQSLLGWAWAVLQPLLLMLIFTLLSSMTSSKVASGGVPYSLFVYAGVLPWSFFSTALANSTNSLVGQTALVTKVWFPREILPLSYVTAALFDFLVASLLLVGLMLHNHVTPTPLVLLAIPLVALISVLAFALGLALAAVQVRYRDIGLAVPLLLQIWMFLSPVIYPFSQVPVAYRWLYQLNPMTGLVEGFRRVTVQGLSPDWHLALTSTLICCGLLPVCYLYFKYVDATIADRM
jgi:lipopolysaccharide transport system permease protein